MPPRRPPSAVGLAAAIVLVCGCTTVSEPPPSPGPVAAPPPPPVVVAALEPEPLEPEVEALPAPPVEMPEITAIALARQVLASEARRLDEEEREQVARVLADAEQELDLEVLLVLALITQESRFDPRAVGPAGSLGLMQVRPFVAEDVARRYDLPWAGEGTLFDPAHNVRIGTHYLAELIDMFGAPELALAAYNMGPYRVKRMLRQGGAPSSRFADRVQEHYQDLRERFGGTGTGWGG